MGRLDRQRIADLFDIPIEMLDDSDSVTWRGWIGWAWNSIGYRIRPFDMLADRRRWFWQPRTPCGFMSRGR